MSAQSDAPSAECGVCARPAPDATICPSCAGLTVAELRQVPWLVEQLEVTLTRQSRTGDRNGPRSAERPLPFDHNASVDLETLRDTLAMWGRSIAERRSIPAPTGNTVTLASWLLLWPSDLAGHPDAHELHDQVVSACNAARRTIDRRPDLKFLGPCDAVGATVLPDDGHNGCGEDLYAHLNARTITCRTPECYAVYDVDKRRAWLLEAAVDQLRTAKQLSDELPWIAGVNVTSKLISMWASRGTAGLGALHTYLPHPQDPRKAQRFRVGEVIDYARAMQQEAQAKRIKVSGAA